MKPTKYVPFERQLGFLHLLEHACKVFGLEVTEYIPVFCRLIVYLIGYSHCRKVKVSGCLENEKTVEIENIEEFLEVEDDVLVPVLDNKHITDQLVRIRSLALVRLAEIISQYQELFGNSAVNLESMTNSIWKYVTVLLPSFPSSVSSSSKPPTLLKLFHAFCVPNVSRFRVENASDVVATCSVITSRPDVIESIIHCVSVSSQYPVFVCVMEILTEVFSQAANKHLVLKYSDVRVFSQNFFVFTFYVL